MKTLLVVKCRWEYLVSKSTELIFVMGLLIWCFDLSLKNGKIDFQSFFFLLTCLQVISLPYLVMNILSVRKSVAVMDSGLLISHLFKKENTFITFSEITRFESKKTSGETVKYPAWTRQWFTISLKDGRQFNFKNTEFANYTTLQSTIYHTIKNNRGSLMNR